MLVFRDDSDTEQQMPASPPAAWTATTIDGSITYYLGIIDLFTEYNTRKRAEHAVKGVIHNKHKISSVPPHEYRNRYVID